MKFQAQAPPEEATGGTAKPRDVMAQASPGTHEAPYERLWDITVAAFLIVVLAPLLGLLWIGVRVTLGTPVLFRQTRPGLRGVPFIMYKFRTMRNDRGSHGALLPDGDRLTRFGRFMRNTSLDELPELFNVLRGDMRMVGPRPLLMQYLSRYTAEQARRHEVKPGITGWAQVNGRNALEWEARFELDVWYVDNRSWWLDLKILAKTVLNVIGRRGINQPGRDTMDEFLGYETEDAQRRDRTNE